MTVLGLRATVCMICLLLSIPGATSAQGPLRVHQDNPRYLTDNTGKAIYLTGGATRFTPPFDGTAVLYLKAIADEAR